MRYVYVLLDVDRRIRYVGQSADPAKRAKIHWYARKTKHHWDRNPELQKWLCSLTSSPEVFILQEVEDEHCFQAETYWIELLRQVPTVSLLNKFTTPWGNGDRPSGAIGAIRSPETRKKIADAHRGRKLSPEHKAKIAEAGIGRVLSEETRKKISDAKTGKKYGPLSPEHRAKLSAAGRGRPMSEEHRRKISEALKNRKRSE